MKNTLLWFLFGTILLITHRVTKNNTLSEVSMQCLKEMSNQDTTKPLGMGISIGLLKCDSIASKMKSN